jgi:hypothetical protein
MIFDNPNKNRTAMPPEWVLANRLQWGLNSVLAHLHATGDWKGIWRELIESPLVAPEDVPAAPAPATPAALPEVRGAESALQ